MALSVADLPPLVTPKAAAEYLGITVSQVRGLIANKKIAFLPLGARTVIPRDAIETFILDNTVQPCREETQARVSAFSKSADAFTLSGPTTGAAASAQRALRTARLLKAR